MSLQPPGESESALSVIPEATEENFGSSALFQIRHSKSKFVLERPVDELAPETVLHTRYTVHAKDEGPNQFRTVVVGKQPYSSCCCVVS